MNHIGLVEKRCCGCRACEQRCPVGAIEMKENAEGFYYPRVIEEKCISCGACQRVCPILKQNRKKNLQNGYAVTIKDFDLLQKSSSGGVFAVLAQEVLQNGGIVFGCAEEVVGHPMHIKVEDVEKLFLLQGSKYVESEMQCTYLEVERELDNRKTVLFAGTPCQVAGLKNFVGERDNLVCVDIICHGVPSRKLYNEHLKWLGNKKRGDVTAYRFRSKQKHNWSLTYCAEVQGKRRKRKYEAMASLDSYYSCFLKGFTYRESCYCCPYACQNRPGDITLGDFWGVEKINERLYNPNGVSAVLINSMKGERIWDSIQEKTIANKVDVTLICKYNGQLNHPCVRPKERSEIYNELNKYGYIHIEKKYRNRKEQVVDYIKDKVPNKIRQKIKGIIR